MIFRRYGGIIRPHRLVAAILTVAAATAVGLLQVVNVATASGLSVAQKVMPPANADANPHFYLVSISCPSAGDCVAFGSYTSTLGATLPAVVTESSGDWGQPAAVTLPGSDASWECGRRPEYSVGRRELSERWWCLHARRWL